MNNNYKLIFSIFLVIAIICISLLIIKGDSVPVMGLLFGMPLALLIIFEPIYGLYLLPIVSNLLPRGINLTGFSFLSPGLIVSIITFFSMVINTISKKRKLKWTQLYLVMISVISIITIRFIASGHSAYFQDLFNYLQSCIVFILFFSIIRNQEQAHRVLTVWTIVYSIFCASYLMLGIKSGVGDDIITNISGLRNQDVGDYNVNTITWLVVLYIPIIIGLISYNKLFIKYFMIFLLFIMMLTILLTSSRAAFFGLIMTLVLFIFFKQNKVGFSLKYYIGIIFLIFLSFYTWSFIISVNYSDGSRALDGDHLNNQFALRTGWIIVSIIDGFEKPIFGHGIADRPFHSVLAKSFFRYGIVYTILIYSSLIIGLKNSYYCFKNSINDKTSLFMKMVFISLIVAVPESIYGATLYSAAYHQVIWLITAYTIFAKNEVRNETSIKNISI